MADREALWINAGSVTQLDSDNDGLLAASVDFGSGGGVLTVGGTNATAVEFGANIDKDAAEALVIGGTNATVVQFGVGIDTDAVQAFNIGGTNATDINIGRVGQTVTIKGDLDVDGAETVTGSATFNGDTDIGDASTDTLTITASVDQAINFAAAVTSHFTTTSGDLKIVPEGTTIAQGGLGVALTRDNYTTNGTTLTATNSSFTTELQVGDAIEVDLDNGTTIDIRRVDSITNDTSLEVNAAFTANVGPVNYALNTDDNLFEVYNGYADARLTMNKNGGATITRGATEQAILTLADEEGSINGSIFVYNGDPDGNVTGTTGDICMSTAAGGKIYFCDADGMNWTAVGSSLGNDLQQAYDAFGGGPATVTLDATGDLTWEVTAGSDWDIIWTDDNGDDFLRVDETNDALILGSTGGVNEREVNFAGLVGTNITFDGTAGRTLTNANTMTVSTTGANLLSLTGGGGVTVTSTGGTLTLDGTGQTVDLNATTLDVDGGDMDFDGTAFNVGAGGAIPVGVAGTTVDIDGTGAVSINSSGDVINVGNDAVAQNINVGTGGARTIQVGSNDATEVYLVADDIDIDSDGAVAATSTTTMDLDAGGILSINSSGGVINVGDDAVAQNINVGTGGARTIQVGSNDATEVYLVADDIDIDSDGAVAIDSTTSTTVTATTSIGLDATTTMDLDAGTTLSLNSDGGAINIGNDDDDFGINIGTDGDRTITIGVNDGTTDVDLVAGATGDITFEARGSAGNSLTYNDAVNQDITGGTYIGAETSIVSALLALDTAVAGVGDTTITYPAAEAITTGDLVALDNGAANTVYQADQGVAAASRAIGVALNGGAIGVDIEIALAGEVTSSSALAAADTGEYVYMNADGAVSTTPGASVVQKVGVITAANKFVIQIGTRVSL